MQPNDTILNANIFSAGNEKYSLAIEYESKLENENKILVIHGNKTLLNLNIQWLKWSTVKVVALHHETRCLHFGFILNPENPFVPYGVEYFEFRCENVKPINL